jgi:hypothetical protein
MGMTCKMGQDRQGSGPRSNVSGVLVRPLLAAGLAFFDVATAEPFHAHALVDWFDESLVRPGIMPLPTSVHEPGAGMVTLAAMSDSRTASGVLANALEARLGRIVTAARVRVATTLGGLLAIPSEDRFFAAAIFAGRVERTSGNRGSGWRPTPTSAERLSDVVLSLFVADALANREEYDACLCVCRTCGRVALRPGVLDRTRCRVHEPDEAGPGEGDG